MCTPLPASLADGALLLQEAHETCELESLGVNCWHWSAFQAPFQGRGRAPAPASGDLVARLMQIHLIAEAAAAALLLGKPLSAADEVALLQLWPWLLRLTAVAPAAAARSPFSASANLVLALQPSAPGKPLSSLTHPPVDQQPRQCGPTLQFDLAADTSPSQTAELQVFCQQVDRCIQQSSKELLEESLSQISRLPSGCAMVRGSIEGHQQPELLNANLRSMLLRRSSSMESPGDTLTSFNICRPSI